MLFAMRRFFARLAATVVSLVTLRLVEVNKTGTSAAPDNDDDNTQSSQVDGRGRG